MMFGDVGYLERLTSRDSELIVVEIKRIKVGVQTFPNGWFPPFLLGKPGLFDVVPSLVKETLEYAVLDGEAVSSRRIRLLGIGADALHEIRVVVAGMKLDETDASALFIIKLGPIAALAVADDIGGDLAGKLGFTGSGSATEDDVLGIQQCLRILIVVDRGLLIIG